MKKMTRLVLVGVCLAATALFAVGCATGPSDERTAIDLPSGRISYAPDILSVVLDENATTGYTWTYEVDGSAVQPAGDEPFSTEDVGMKDENVAGAPVAHLFEFTPTGSGEAAVTLRYERSWEDVDPINVVVVRATVQDGVFTQVEAEEQQA